MSETTTTPHLLGTEANAETSQMSAAATEAPSEARSAFDAESIGPVTIIMLMRLYDLNLALLSAVDPEKAQALVDLHARGQSFAPPPSFVEYDAES